MRRELRSVLLAGVLLFACKKANSDFCPDPDAVTCNPSCDTSEDCTGANTRVCDPDSSSCVQCTADHLEACPGDAPACIDNRCSECTENAQCSGATPVCVDHTCSPCTAHAQCSATSNACGPDGACLDADSVAYVSSMGTDNLDCSLARPCTKVSSALLTNRPFVKFTGTITEAVTVDHGRVVTFLADPQASLTSGTGVGGTVIVRDDNTSLKVYDFTISHFSGNALYVPPSSGAPAISLTRVTLENSSVDVNGTVLNITNSAMRGVSATGRSVVTVTGSKIIGGGILVGESQFALVNNWIALRSSQAFGGVLLRGTNDGMRRFEFNTVTRNISSNVNNAHGVACDFTQPVTFSNNIVYGNGEFPNSDSQTGGGDGVCTWNYSAAGFGLVGGVGNVTADPMFVDSDRLDFHLRPGSLAKNAADPNATLDIDIDGDARPQDGRRDMGADEIVP